jgi:hypothetical protein
VMSAGRRSIRPPSTRTPRSLRLPIGRRALRPAAVWLAGSVPVPPARRRPQQVRNAQRGAPGLEQRGQRLRRIRDLTRIDDSIVVCVQRLDHRRKRRRRAISARPPRSSRSSRPPRTIPRPLPQGCARRSGAAQGDDPGLSYVSDLSFHNDVHWRFGIRPFVTRNFAPHC